MEKLGHAVIGSGHDVSLSSIVVQCDIKFSLYWLKQFQRYHFFQINSSQSTMHSLKKLELRNMCNKYVDGRIISIVQEKIDNFIDVENSDVIDNDLKYKLFMEIISSIPSGIEMWMAITTNYLQLKTIYYQRRTHKLKEDWGYFCKWCLTLPYFEKFCIY
jgi:hypothetical protein